MRQNAPAIDAAIAELRNDFRQQIVQYGAVGRLAFAREVEVWPLDDEQLLDKANPVLPDGRIKLEAANVPARHDAQVAAARKAGPCSVLILGGAHDLSGSIRKVGNECEYIRITTTRYKETVRAR